jgi:LysR family transcriptional regulator, transcription activator of glutamate synthase operon
MEINYLKEFVVLAQTGNFMEAADILFSSQSTLSKHIQSIEAELGVSLFDRTTRKVRISKFGELLLPYAQQIAELQDKYTAVLKSSLETDRDILTVGSIPALAQYKIIDIFVNFKKSRPQSTLNVMQAGSEELKEMLRHKKCELAFIRFTDEVDDDLEKIPYAVDTMVAVLPIVHPLAKQKTVPLRMLADEDFLLIEKQTYLYRLCISACKLSGFEPKIAFTDHKVGILVDLVIKGMGVALLMKQLALYVSNPKTAIVDISPSVSTQICLCHLKGVELSDAAKHFVLCAESISKNAFT